MRIFGTFLLVAWTLVTLYVVGRVSTLPWVRRRIPPKVLFPSAGVLWASFVLARIHGNDGAGPLLAALEQCGMNALAILFLLAVPLLAVDVVTGFGLLARPLVPRLRGAALVAGGLLTAVALVQGLRPPVVREYEVRLPGLPAALDGTTVVALSDLHLGSLLGEKWLAARVAQVRALRPDLVVLLGDLFEGHGRPAGEFLPLLKRLEAPLGVWAVNGNHESHGARGASDPAPEQSGFTVLHDRWVEVRPGLVLAGVDDLTSRRRAGVGGDPVGTALAGRPPGAAVLLSHSPLEVVRAAAAGAGLMLSGHTHGGQIWPFGYLARLNYPFFAGRYAVDGMTLIVSRGTGTWGPRLRLWHPGEIVRVTLRAGN
ncbi:MAG: metallophosphoesterase [Candidatus Methylomirabilia bacterium]